MKTLPAILSLASCLLSVPVLAEKPAELNKMRFEFEVELAELLKPLQNLNAKYHEHLEKQKGVFQQAGNLEAVLAVDAEMKIFEADLSKEFSAIPELKRLQEIYREQKRKVNNQLIGKKLPLIRSYSDKSKELSVQWTKEGKLDDAKLALEESKRITAMVSNLPLPKSEPAEKEVANKEKEKETVTGKVVGTWVKIDTGTEFEFRQDGTVVAPRARAQIFASGEWELRGKNLTLVFPHGSLRLRLAGDDLIESRDPETASWGLRKVATPTTVDPPTSISDSEVLAPVSATKERPFVNSLKMQFVPVLINGGPTDGQTVLFSVWETRVEDYEAFSRDVRDHPLPNAAFPQDDDHPVVNLFWDEAKAFCEWLTEKEQKRRKISKDQRYRLPTDHEWSCAVGIGQKEAGDLPPEAKNRKIVDVYPWGVAWPPTPGAGNYGGEEMKKNPAGLTKDQKPIEGYEDSFDRTAPVGSFEPNSFGLHDMGGNAMEWCEDWYSSKQKDRVRRGGSWMDSDQDILLSSFRSGFLPAKIRSYITGFRCVLAQ